MLSSGSFGDFLNSLREFESGVSEARIEQNRAEIIQQVGQDRLAAFEAGELTLTDLQYSSENFLGFVGYQFGEPILIDLGYYEFDSTPGVNDFTGTFTGKNGVTSLDELKTNIQELVILDEFQLNLDRIETGLGNAGRSLDEFIGTTITATDTDGTQTQVELSLTGILASAHLRGAFGTLDFLLNSVASADEIGTSNIQFIEQFGGFDAPSITELRAGSIEPLVTDATLTIDQPFEDRGAGAPVVIDAPDEPAPTDVANGGDAPVPDAAPSVPDVADGGDAPQPAPAPAPTPQPAPSPVAGSDAGVPDAPAGTPAAAAAVQIRTFDRDTGSFNVTGTEGDDDAAYGENGDDIIRTFGGNDTSVAFAGNDFQDLGAGNDRGYGLSGDDTMLGGSGDDTLNGGTGDDVIVGGRDNDTLRGDAGADRFVFSAGDGEDIIKDFETSADILDFSEFGNNPEVVVSQQGVNSVLNVGDVTVVLEGVNGAQLTTANFLGATFNGVVAPTPVAQAPDPVDPTPDPAPDPVAQAPDPVDPTPDPAPDAVTPPDPTPAPTPTAGGGDTGIPDAPAGTPEAVSPVFLRTFDAAANSFTVTGTDGIDSSAYGFLGDDIIRTFGGVDSAIGFQGNDFLDLGDGDDRGWGLEGDDILLGGNGNDVLNGDDGDFAGSTIESGSDVIVGGRGDDILRGDTINTNQAADRFVFAAGDGNDTIRDFQVNLDTLDFSEFGNTPAVSVSEQNGNTVVGVGDVTVTLEGVSADTLVADNFLGANFNGGFSFAAVQASAPAAQIAADQGNQGAAADQGPTVAILPDVNEVDVLTSLVPDDSFAAA